jgi:hypothetical protein
VGAEVVVGAANSSVPKGLSMPVNCMVVPFYRGLTIGHVKLAILIGKN